jgi:hypothetical protein
MWWATLKPFFKFYRRSNDLDYDYKLSLGNMLTDLFHSSC